MTTETLLQQGIVAARAGRREEARALLMQVVQADERSEQGWFWLSGVVDDPDDMRTCLQNVLDLNPGNEKAQQGLAWVDSRYGPPAAKVEPEPAAAQEPAHNTGPTTKLDAEVVPATPEPAAQAQQPAVPAAQPHLPPAEVVAPASNPCPYCGTSTLLSQNSCLQCRNSLMMRAAPREKRSVATMILGILWGLSGILTVISGLATLGVGIYVGTASGRGFLRQFNLPRSFSPTIIIAVGVVILFLGGLYVALARGLLRRGRWAYLLHVFFTALGLLGTVANIVFADAITAQGLTEEGDAVASLFCTVILQIGYIALTILSHRDFYGPKMRFQPEVDTTDHMGHFNNGLAYKSRGMWYMAMREWEAAVSKSSKDLDYLHALGLAYAQVKQFTKARETLDTALSLAPSDARLQESRALVDRLATQRR